MPKYLTPIDLVQNELQNATIQNLASAPSNPKPGQIYFDTTQNTIFVYTGSAWKDLAQVLTAADILTLLKTDDGSGTGLDADTLDGHDTSYFLTTTGNAASATKLATARTISLGGDATGSASFDGTANQTITVVLANSGATAGTYTKVTIDAKGRVTSATTLSASDIPSLDWSKITSGKPTTISGYGITDAIKNGGNVPSLQSGLDASKPTATGSKVVYLATDSGKIYQDTASGTWTKLGGQDTLDWSKLVNVPATFTPPIASTTTLGGIKAGANVTIDSNGVLNAADNPNAFIRKQEFFTLTAGQTVLTLTAGTYKPGTTCMSWFMNGIKQDDRALTEVSTTEVDLPSGLPAGTEIMLEWFETINMNPFPYHASEHLSGGADPIPDATDSQDGLMAAADKTKLDGLGTAAQANLGTAAGNVPVLDSGGKIDQGVLPALAITEVHQVANIAAMLALTAQEGDVAVVASGSDSEPHTYILSQSPASTQANWLEITTPGQVVSVNGKTGTVTLTAADVGLGNVNNTADSAKNVATAEKLTTPRTIATSGDATGTATSFDGSANITIPLTLAASGATAGTYKSVTVNAKGLVTGGTNPTTLAGYGITDALPASGTAVAASKLATARTIALTGDSTGSGTFDGSGNLSITTALAVYRTKKYATTIGDGTTTSFKLTHNLGSQDVSVTVREVATNAVVIPDITITDTNNVTVAFATAPTSGQYRVTVVG